MIELIKYWGILLVAIIGHELIHYLVLRILGYGGKFVLIPKRLCFGIKPIGMHDNFICAYNLIFVLVAPFFFTLVMSMSAFCLIYTNFWFALCFGFMFATFGSLFDFRNSVNLYKTWEKSRKFYKP